MFLRRDGGGNDALEEEGRHRDIYIQAHIQRGRGRGERHRYIAQHIEKYVFQKYKESIPMLPFQQLLSVLPPKSHRLIPEPLNKLLSDENSDIKKYCPDKIEIDVSGKRQEWEGIVILPIVDFEVIKEEYGKHIDKVSEKDMRRNVVGKSYIYNYSPNTSFIFKSFYGDIQECKMTRKIIDL